MRAEEGLDLARWIAEKVALGRLSRAEAESQLAAKLGEDCPCCQALFDETVAALYSPPPLGILPRRGVPESFKPAPSASRTPSSRATTPKRARQRSRALPAAELEARGLAAFETLTAHGWARRRERVRLEWQRFRGLPIAERMLAAGLACLPADPEEAARWAEMVLLVLSGDRNPKLAPQDSVVLRLRARLLEVNAARCRGELDAAADDWRFTVLTADVHDVRDLQFWLDAKRFATPLRRDQRDFPAAVLAGRTWAALARAAASPPAEVQARWSLATVHLQKGDFAPALVAIRLAMPLLVELSDPSIELGVRHTEVEALVRLHQWAEAEQQQQKLAPLYRSLPAWRNVRPWLEGLIHAGLGRPAEAEAAFLSSRDGFLADKNAYDAALVTLDWSLFLLDQGRAEEVLPLAMAMGQAFEALGVTRETLASWAIFQAAAERRELDRAVAEELVRRVGDERGGRKGR